MRLMSLSGRNLLGMMMVVAVGLMCDGAFGAEGDIGLSAGQYRDYALSHDGDVAAGEKLFNDSGRLVCANCHAMEGKEKSGPNLEGVGDKFEKTELVRHILEPSAFVEPGYDFVAIEKTDGEVVAGRLLKLTKLQYELVDAVGKKVTVKRAKFKSMQMLKISMMPENQAAALTAKEFGDLVSYLESLKISALTGFKSGGAPVDFGMAAQPIAFEAVKGAEGFRAPVFYGPLLGFEGQFVVVEHQDGKVWRLSKGKGGKIKRHLFLDIEEQISPGGTTGLMCIVFHPDYVKNGRYFIEHEVMEEGQLKTTVVERRATKDRMRDSGKVARRLLAVDQPSGGNNGGNLVFGPDGMLYAGFGDGGPGKDIPGHGQNGGELLSSLIRIDVDGKDAGLEYAIPKDNPFVGMAGLRGEVWATGIREPWRFSFDSLTGELWLGDVGQDLYEEVTIVKRGENHGWNVYEGYDVYSDEFRRSGEAYVEPLFAYPHKFGVSIIGGHVYRGDKGSPFYGAYVFGDSISRRVWALKRVDGKLAEVVQIGRSPEQIASFGLDTEGEMYVVGYMGTIYKLGLRGVVNE